MATKQQKEDFKESKARVLSIFEKILDFTFSNEMHRPGERREGWSNSPNALADIDSEFSLSEFDYRTWKTNSKSDIAEDYSDETKIRNLISLIETLSSIYSTPLRIEFNAERKSARFFFGLPRQTSLNVLSAEYSIDFGYMYYIWKEIKSKWPDSPEVKKKYPSIGRPYKLIPNHEFGDFDSWDEELEEFKRVEEDLRLNIEQAKQLPKPPKIAIEIWQNQLTNVETARKNRQREEDRK